VTTWAITGHHTRDLLTYRGRPIVHDSREEIEWLLPSARVVPVTDRDLRARSPLPPLQLRDHPSLSHVRWPLDRAQFLTSGRSGFGRPSGLIRIYSSADTTGST
jgi:hypothetical protein